VNYGFEYAGKAECRMLFSVI